MRAIFWAIIALSVGGALFIVSPFLAVWIVWPRRRPPEISTRRNTIAAIVANYRNQ